MSPNSVMGGELQFQQRWEFRRKDDDFDSSSDDSKSSSIAEPVLKKHKLVTGLISLDNYETSNANTLQQNRNCNLGFGDQTEVAKAKEQKIERGKKISFVDTQMKRDCLEEVDTKKRTSVYDPAALDDVKNFRVSLLEDLKATGENLFTWMREEMNKLVAADDLAPKRGRRKRTSRGKKVQLQDKSSHNKNMQLQKQVNFEKNVQQNNIEENIRVQHLSSNGTIVHKQRQNNFEKDTEVQHQNNFERNIQVQHQNNFKSGMGAQKCNDGSWERLAKSVEAADSINHSRALRHRVDYGRTIRQVASEKEKGEGLALTVNSNLLSGPSNKNAQLQHPKSVVLAIRAQNCKDGFSERSVRRKKTGDPHKHYRIQEDRVGYNQAIGSMTSTENDKAEGLKLSVQKSSSPNPADQVASSMYLTLPTVLSKPHDSNNWLDTFLSSYMEPRVSGNKTSENLERARQMHDSSTHFGYIPNIHPEARTANFAQMGSTSVSCFDQNGTQPSSTGTGFPFPLHHSINSAFSIPSQFSLENIPQENGNTLGLQMNGGAVTFSGGSSALSGNFVANNLLNHSNSKGDSRLMPYQIPSITDGYGFPE